MKHSNATVTSRHASTSSGIVAVPGTGSTVRPAPAAYPAANCHNHQRTFTRTLRRQDLQTSACSARCSAPSPCQQPVHRYQRRRHLARYAVRGRRLRLPGFGPCRSYSANCYARNERDDQRTRPPPPMISALRAFYLRSHARHKARSSGSDRYDNDSFARRAP